jgi:hypothetical protein
MIKKKQSKQEWPKFDKEIKWSKMLRDKIEEKKSRKW